jgi:hypothetical protein
MAKNIKPKHEPEVLRKKHAGGRPTDYRKEYAEQAKHLCRLGATDEDLAYALRTSITAIKRWRAVHAEFRAALVVGKKEADDRVIRSLYTRAVGYSFDSVKVFMPAGAKQPIYAPIVEHVPPSETAAMFWLKNRDPEHWRDVQQLEHSMGKYVISDKPMTEEQWALERADVIDVTPEKDAEKESPHDLPSEKPKP